MKKFQATPTKQDPGTFFGVKMSDEHPVLSVRESPPSPGYSQKTCKKDCSDAVPGVKCKVRVKPKFALHEEEVETKKNG